MRIFRKKIVNPALDAFVKNLQTRGFLLVEGRTFRADIFIPDTEEFLKFGKRESAHTIFREADRGEIRYTYIVDGMIVLTVIPIRIKE